MIKIKEDKKDRIRTDIFTKKKYQQEDLIRIDIKKDGTTKLDFTQTSNGRGIYFHKNSLKTLAQKKFLEKQVLRFKGNFSQIESEINKIISKEGGDWYGKK